MKKILFITFCFICIMQCILFSKDQDNPSYIYKVSENGEILRNTVGSDPTIALKLDNGDIVRAITDGSTNNVVVACYSRKNAVGYYLLGLNADTLNKVWEFHVDNIIYPKKIFWVNDHTVLAQSFGRGGSSYLIFDLTKKSAIVAGACGMNERLEIKGGKIYKLSTDVDENGEGKQDASGKQIPPISKLIFNAE